MQNFEQLKDSVKRLLSPKETRKGVLSSDLTATIEGDIFFLTHVFKDGFIKGFWTHSPWGTSQDKEQGWVIISPDLDVVASCETKTDGRPAGNNFRKWSAEQLQQHGSAFKLQPEWENELFWKISDN